MRGFAVAPIQRRRDALVVDIETNVKHGYLLKSMELGIAAT
jgi:hypothetical protein